MVKASELRIGNLLTDAYYENFKTIIEVESINSKGIDLFIDDDGGYPECRQEWIEPNYTFDLLYGIPLTEEWLLKFGFVPKDKWNYGLNCLEINKTVSIDGKELDFFTNRFNDEYFIIPLNYVHQLQNLYFALTSEELTIK